MSSIGTQGVSGTSEVTISFSGTGTVKVEEHQYMRGFFASV